MRNPEPGPFGDTVFEARDRAMVAAAFVNRPAGGCVESVVTLAIHLLFLFPDISDINVLRAINTKYHGCVDRVVGGRGWADDDALS